MANKHIKRWSISLIIEKYKSKLQLGIASHRPEGPPSKRLQTVHAGEHVEKREPSYTVGGDVSWCSHYGKQNGGASKN